MSSGLSVAITTGIAALVGGAAAWKIQNDFKKIEESKRKDLTEVVHLISIEDIGKLLDSDNLEVQQAAEKLLKQRAISKQYLPAILQCCLSNDKETALKAVNAVFLLCKSSNESKPALFKESALDVLLKVMRTLSDNYQYKVLVSRCKDDLVIEGTFFNSIGAIFHLTLNDPRMMQALFKEKSCVRDIFLHIMSDHGFHILTDVKRWATYIIHQLVQIDGTDVKKSLKKWGIITKSTLCLIRTLGDLLLTQLCLQILVQYLNDNVDEIVRVCQEIASLGALPHLVGLLRCEEEENVIQLSAIIIHHFCCFDIDVRNLAKTPGIIKILLTVLNSNEASVQKTILRIFNYLCISSSTFQKKILSEKPLLKRLSVCLASGNKDVVQGSLMLLHDLAMPGKQAAQKLILANPDILKALVTLSLSSTVEQAQLVAETLGFFCSCESLHSVLLKQGVINAILHFTKSSDTSVQFWASALLLNLSMISDEIKEAIVRNGGMFILLEMAISGDEVEMPDIASNATKAMVILGFLDTTIDVKLQAGMDASIIVDGTEYCPGKQGINVVSLDFINFKFTKGQVLQPSKFDKYLLDKNSFSTKKWDPVFIVTQGDCTLTQDEESKSLKELLPSNQIENFLKAPVWTMLISPKETKVSSGNENLSISYKISLSDCVNHVLKDNFTDPLIEVLLSYPPSSSTNKSEDLELVEILARHSFQRKAIVTTAGFLEYLNEMLWDIISLKIKGVQDPENATKVAHCVAALKIIHACSIDKTIVSELVNRGMPKVVLCLLVSIMKFLLTAHGTDIFSFNRQDSILESDEKGNQKLYIDDDSILQPNISGNLHFDMVTASNDNIFYEEEEEPGNPLLSAISETSQTGEIPNITTRRRADSYIVRADNKSRQRSESRQAFLDRSISIDQQQQEVADTSVAASPYATPSRRALNMEDVANHQQMRRISRSMSISLQNTKSAFGEELNEILPDTDEVIKKMTKHAVMSIYHLMQNADEKTLEQLHSMHYVAILYAILSSFDGSFKNELGLPISSAIVKSSKYSGKRCIIDATIVEHVSSPESLIISTNKLEVSNENWYFESVRSNQPVSTSLYNTSQQSVAGWYYEIVVFTKGIMQLGWANEECIFDSHKGIGVGDTSNSCGFDGTRCKVWSGPSIDVMEENDYGMAWQSGDVVSVLLSWDGVISFWLNGKDLGPVQRYVDTSKMWYPAASLSVDQHCTFIFKEADMRFKKGDFICVEDVFRQFGKFNKLEEKEIHLNSDQLIREQQVKPGPQFGPMYFFEVDLSCIPKNFKTVSIGYIRNNKSQDVAKTDEDENKDIIQTVVMEFFQGISNVPVLGCGIVLATKHLILTKGKDVFWESPLSDVIITNEEFTGSMFLNMVPYFSVENVDLNVGQKLFSYDQANTNRCKQSFMKLIWDMEREEDDGR